MIIEYDGAIITILHTESFHRTENNIPKPEKSMLYINKISFLIKGSTIYMYCKDISCYIKKRSKATVCKCFTK